ncbi:LCP family protein [Arthrobacter sp. KFRI-F3372]|uniref:LCP family protein n=1 Tax=Arthrobacter oryzae TaxID=409290 RepID=UPI0027822C44|nr:LCP family protein [Arthrobacter oryzae]MDP9989013.1 LCP family protein required for cell wall assembly [Arthrobacter oryzae]WHP61079.1 LCP family protein [Arthrobacter sp. KFRI-F3372]
MLSQHDASNPDPGPSAPVRYPGQGKLVSASARRFGYRRAPRWVRIGGAVAAAVLVAVLVFGGYWASRLQSNITASSLGAGGHRSEGPVNDRTDRLQILVLGTDTRDGDNSGFGTADQSSGYGQSDVMMLLDISADNKNVNVVSFPRDLLVDVPACTDAETGQKYEARPGAMINSAMAQAGIGCAIDTVNNLTDLEIDHFMMADFNAVRELSNAVGGVEVCVSDAVSDPGSGLRLPEGTSTVKGKQALAFLRTRHAFADGGDLGRIKAQQAFLGSLTRKLKTEGTLGKPQRMLGIADAVTKNLTVDEELASVPALLTIVGRLKTIDPGRVNFITAPTVPAADPNRLDFDEPAATNLFAALRKSADLTEPAPDKDPTADESTDTQPEPAYDKALQPVTVANGTAVPGRAEDVQNILTGDGYTNISGFQAQVTEQTMVYHGTGFNDVAADIAAMFGLPATRVQPAGVPGVQVHAGTDFAFGTKPAVEPPSLTDHVSQTAEQQTCQETNPFG